MRHIPTYTYEHANPESDAWKPADEYRIYRDGQCIAVVLETDDYYLSVVFADGTTYACTTDGVGSLRKRIESYAAEERFHRIAPDGKPQDIWQFYQSEVFRS